MEELSAMLCAAKEDNEKLNQLILQYMPFIKSEIMKTPVFAMDYDDRLSLAMVVFMNCVRQYEKSRGGFFAYAAVCIRHRLIDEGMKQKRRDNKIIPLFSQGDRRAEENSTALREYSISLERDALAEEINRLSAALEIFGVSFLELTKIAPKQKRSRILCIRLAKAILADPAMKNNLFVNRRLSQSALAKQFQISERTVEKHRKYIVAAAVVLDGDYIGIQGFLPKELEVD